MYTYFNHGFNVSTTLWGHCGPEYTVELTLICNNKTNSILCSCELYFVLFVFIISGIHKSVRGSHHVRPADVRRQNLSAAAQTRNHTRPQSAAR